MPVTNFPLTKLITYGDLRTAYSAGDIIFKNTENGVTDPASTIYTSSRVVGPSVISYFIALKAELPLKLGSGDRIFTWDDLYTHRYISTSNHLPATMPHIELPQNSTSTPMQSMVISGLNTNIRGTIGGYLEISGWSTNQSRWTTLRYQNLSYKRPFEDEVSIPAGNSPPYDGGLHTGMGALTVGPHGYTELTFNYQITGIPVNDAFICRFVLRLPVTGSKRYEGPWFAIGYQAENYFNQNM